MYKSPIYKLISDIVTEEENAVMRAVVKCGINVDKDELIKALAYDRRQYDLGYADGKMDANAELIRCKDCIHNVANRKTDPMDITDYSGQDIVCDYFMTDGQEPDDYCSHAERIDQ